MSSRLAAPHRIVFAVLVAGALLAAALLLPGDSERIAMLERDGKNQEALTLLEARFAAGDRRERTLFQLHHLYEHFGDLPKARQTLELLAQSRPRDANLQRQLAQFYKLVQDEPAYIAALGRQLALRYAEPACRELIGLHRRAGREAEERAAIDNCRQRGYRRAEDLVRLADLLAAGSDLGQAATILRSVDDLRRLRGDTERLTLFSLLVDLGQSSEAVLRGVRWARARDGHLLQDMIDRLTGEGQHDLAISLVRQSSGSGEITALAIAEILLMRGQGTAALSYLRGWMAKATLTSGEDAERVADVALAVGDARLAFGALDAVKLEVISQEGLAATAEALAAEGAWPQFGAVAARIEPETLAANPLLAAAVRSRTMGGEPVRPLLALVPVKELETWRLALWRRLAAGEPRRGVGNLAQISPGVTARLRVAATAVSPVTLRAKRTRRLRAARPPSAPAAPSPAPKAAASKG